MNVLREGGHVTHAVPYSTSKINMKTYWNAFAAIKLTYFVISNAQSFNVTKPGDRLRIGLMGVLSNLYTDESGVLKGSDVRMLRVLSEKMGFTFNISLMNYYDELVNKVRFDNLK